MCPRLPDQMRRRCPVCRQYIPLKWENINKSIASTLNAKREKYIIGVVTQENLSPGFANDNKAKQAGLSLALVETQKTCFCRVEVQLFSCNHGPLKSCYNTNLKKKIHLDGHTALLAGHTQCCCFFNSILMYVERIFPYLSAN